jgi:hypothetical protein
MSCWPQKPGDLSIRGFGLPVILLFLTLVITLSVVAAASISHYHQEVENRLSSTRASYAAEAGVARVLLELSLDPNYNPGTLVLPDSDPKALDFSDKSLGAEVEIINNFAGTTSVPTPDGPLGPGRVWCRSRGKLSGKFFRSQSSTAKAILTRPDVVMNYGLRQLQNQIVLGANNSIGSYLSAVGADPKPPGSINSNVRLRTNELGILIPGSTVFNGAVDLPTASTPVTGTVLGGTQVKQEAPPILKFSEPTTYRSLPHPNYTGSSINLAPNRPYGGVYVNAGGTLRLTGGEYFIGECYLQPGADIVVTGATATNPCIVYLGSGFLALGNNDINWNGAPRTLQIYGCDAERDAIDDNGIMAGSRVSCVWAGRETSLTLGNNVQFYGAADIREMKFGSNCQLIFDETLAGEVLEGKPEWVLTKKER